MKQFMSRYFSIAFMFVVAASFVACNYSPEGEPATDVVEVSADSTAALPFDIDSIETVDQLLDSLDAVKVD